MNEHEIEIRENAKRIAASYAERGDATGWFDELYKEAAGDNEHIPWADLEPNKFLKAWAEKTNLQGNGRKALVVGCGLGDDAKFLDDLGFKVTAFDISPTAVEWAKRLYSNTNITFETADLFDPPAKWLARNALPAAARGTDRLGGFDFVLEVYTIQPLPLEMRSKVIDSIAAFVGEKGKLVVVTRGREDNEEPVELPWALSRKDLSRFEANGLRQIHFDEMWGDEEEPIKRFVVEYERGVSA